MTIVFVLLFSFACIFFSNDGTENNLEENIDSSSQEPIVEQEVTYGPGDFVFTDPTEALTSLSSYKATLIISFNGTRDGNPETWSATYVILTTTQPVARFITMDTTGTETARLIQIEMDGAQYKKSGDKNCVADSLIEGQPFDEPASFLRGVVGAETSGSDLTNGIATNRYTFDQRALGEQGITESTGELWVASEGGYLVKYLLTTKADENYLGEGIDGTVTWDYQINEINSITSIDLPADCPPALPQNIPMMQDATNVEDFFSVIDYQTASTPKDVIAFYEEEMSLLGWNKPDATSGLPGGITIPEIPNMPDISNFPQMPGLSGGDETQDFIEFVQGNKTITITAQVGDTNTEVSVIINSEQ